MDAPGLSASREEFVQKWNQFDLSGKQAKNVQAEERTFVVTETAAFINVAALVRIWSWNQ